MRPLPAVLLLAVLGIGFGRACAEEDVVIQRYLAHLYLGDVMEDIQRIYAPAQEWPSYLENTGLGHVKRYRVERSYLKVPDPKIDTMYLGMKKSALRAESLVEIQLVYTAKYSRSKSAEELAGDLALIYGEPHRSEGKFWWSDGKTVLRVFYAEVPVLKGGGQGVELRTSLQIMEQNLFQRTDS